jgi:hypothetical protein
MEIEKMVNQFCLPLLLQLPICLMLVSCSDNSESTLYNDAPKLIVEDSSALGIRLKYVVPRSLIGNDRVDISVCEVTSTLLPAPTRMLLPDATVNGQFIEYRFRIAPSVAEIQIGGDRNGDFAADLSITKVFRKQPLTMYDTLMKEFQDVETPNSALLMQHAYRKVVASSDTSAFRSSVLIAFEMALGSRTVRDAVASILASHASTGVLDSWKFSSILMWCIAELNTAQAEEAVSMIYRAYPFCYFATSHESFLREGLQASDIDYLFEAAQRTNDSDSAIALRCAASTLSLRRNAVPPALTHTNSLDGVTLALTSRFRQGNVTPLLLTAYRKRQVVAWAELQLRIPNISDSGFAEPLTVLKATFSAMDPRLGALYFAVGKGHRMRGNNQMASYHYAAACRIAPSQSIYRDSLARVNNGQSSDEDVLALCEAAEEAGVVLKQRSAYALPMAIMQHIQRTDKPTLLAFVSETCSPCVHLLEEIGQSIHRFGGANFIIVPIGEWHVNPENKYGRFTYAQLTGQQAQFARSMHIQATPSVVIFDARNNFSQRIDGKPQIGSLVNAVQRVNTP